jgi:hypothetical protein
MSIDTVDEWVKRHKLNNYSAPYDLDELFSELTKDDGSIVIADYDSVAQDINRLSTDYLLNNMTIKLS